MDTFPKINDSWTAVHDDRAPVVQGGVCSAINGEKYIHWYGRLSELAEGGRAIKFPKGYLPERYVVSAKPIEDPVGRYGLGVTLAKDTSVTLSAAAKKRAEYGTTTESGESNAAFSGVTIAGPTDAVAESGTSGQPGYVAAKDATDATYGVVAQGSVTSGAMVTDHNEYVVLAVSGSGLDRAANDCFVEAAFIIRQVSPDGVIEFHH